MLSRVTQCIRDRLTQKNIFSSAACLHCPSDCVLRSASLQALLNQLPPATSAWRPTKLYHNLSHSSSPRSLPSRYPRTVLAPGSTLQIPEVGADCTFLLLLVFDPCLQMLDLPAEVRDDAGVLVDVVGDIPQVTFYLVSQNT